MCMQIISACQAYRLITLLLLAYVCLTGTNDLNLGTSSKKSLMFCPPKLICLQSQPITKLRLFVTGADILEGTTIPLKDAPSEVVRQRHRMTNERRG